MHVNTNVQTMDFLKELLQEVGVDVDDRRFSSAKGIEGLSEPFVGIVPTIEYGLTFFSIYRILNTEYT